MMKVICKYTLLAILTLAGSMLLYRAFHRLTKLSGRISQIKVEPYYNMHKDSSHYAVTFRLSGDSTRFGVYVGSIDRVRKSNLPAVLSTDSYYNIEIDETVPNMEIGVRKIESNGKIIYKESQLFNVGFGCGFLLIATLVFFKFGKSKNNVGEV